MPPDVLPRDARLIALLISACPSLTDAQPAVLHQLLEFAHRYTAQVLSDALVYSEHAGRGGSVDEEDVKLAVQSRVGWEFGGKIPKEYLLSLAAKTNAKPLPAVPEVYGVRLPPTKNCLTAVDFDIVPNKPPPGVKLTEDEDDEGDEEDEDDEESDGDQKDQSGDYEMASADNLFAITDEVNEGDEGGGKGGRGDEGDEDDLFGDEEEDEEMANVDDEANGIGGARAGEKRALEEDYDEE
ncbi:Transcription initiation factor TFIID subunit 9 [Tulasnella sp. 417]|nr:Transcription initiation factor TFIID subunit 9 [Tulasnella sp. 417]